MGRIVKRGDKYFIQNIRNKVLGRRFATRALALKALAILKRRR